MRSSSHEILAHEVLPPRPEGAPVGQANFVPLAPDGAPRVASLGFTIVLASLQGEFYDRDRPAVVQGRMAAPGRRDTGGSTRLVSISWSLARSRPR